MSSKIVIRKSKFLELVFDIYGKRDLEYILSLSQALMIVYKTRKEEGNLNFEDYDGILVFKR